MIRGIFTNPDGLGKPNDTHGKLVYKYGGGRVFVISYWNVFSTIHFVQECLKRFGKEGDKFIRTNNKDYKVSTSKKVGSEDAVTDTGNTVTGTMTEDNTIITYTNNKEGIIPTGVLLSATPWIILGVVLIAGIVFFAIRSKKKYEDE